MKNPVITFEDFSFRYHLREDLTLRNINLQITKGEFIVLTGSSGSGKSTICYSILGLIPNFYAGELNGNVIINDQNTKSKSVFSISESIGYIPQRVESSLVTPYVFTELAFPLEYQDYEQSVMHEQIENVSNQLNLKSLLSKNPQKTSEGEKQKIAIGCSLIRNPSIIVADEPLANLDKSNQVMIKAILEKLSEEGKTIIVATHEYEQYLSLASRIIKLEQGSLRDEISLTKEHHQKIEDRRKVDSKEKNLIQKEPFEESNEPLLELEDIMFEFPDSFKLSNISFTAYSGEIIGIIGDNGSGKTTLLNIISCILKPNQGILKINNKEIRNLNWKERSKKLGFVFQNPELQFFEETIKEEIVLTKMNLEGKIDYSETTILLKESGLQRYEYDNPHSLSYGEKRRLTFLASIFHNPDIIMLDEITNGLDSNNKNWIKNKILDLKLRGKITLIVSHDWDWLSGLVDRVLFLKDGKIETGMDAEQFDIFLNTQKNKFKNNNEVLKI